MTNITKKLKIYLYASFALIALCVILGSLSYLFSFNSDIGYFDASALPTVFSVICALSVLVALAAFFVVPRNTIDGAAPNKAPAAISAIPLCVASVLLGGFLLISSFWDLFLSPKPQPYHAPTKYMMLICGILLLVSAVYFAMLLSDPRRESEAKAVPGFAVPLACVLLVAVTYFDLMVTMNSPVKMHFQFSMLAFSAFSLCELKVPLKRSAPRVYLALGILAALCSGIASIPQIVAFMSKKIDMQIFLYYAIFNLCIFIYTVARLCVFVNSQSLIKTTSAEADTAKESEISEESQDAQENPEDSEHDIKTDALAPNEDQQNSDNETENQENVSE